MKTYRENNKLEIALSKEIQSLIQFVEQTEFKGWEPYSPPFFLSEKNWLPGFVRVLWTQSFRLSPIPFYRFFKEKKIYAKAMALFAHSYLILYKNKKKKEYKTQAIYFLNWLEQNRSSRTHNFSLGTHYSIAMKSYVARGDTPSPLITSMAVEAFISAYEILGEKQYLDLAGSGVNYFLNDLPQHSMSDKESYFIYHPNNPKFIPNLPAVICGTLSRYFSLNKNQEIFQTIIKNLNHIVKWQRKDGSWLYEKNARYVDNFHTGFVLGGLAKFELFCGDKRFHEAFTKGLNYWQKNLFAKNGKPIHRKLLGFPKNADALLTRIDLRDFAQSFVLFSYLLRNRDNTCTLPLKLLQWAVEDFKSEKGYFYYQRIPLYTLKGPFISMQAWMLYGMVRLWDSLINSNRDDF